MRNTGRTRLAAALGAGLAAIALAAPAQAECGRVAIANMTWATAEFAAHLDRIVLEAAFGCEVELVPGDTVPTVASMIERGQPDIAPEMWTNNAGAPLAAAFADGRVVRLVKILSDGPVEGWFVPDYFRESHPEVATVDDALARPDLFPHPEYDGVGAVYGCPSGWACQYVMENQFRAWRGGEKGFELVDPGSAAGLAGALTGAYDRGEAWLGYYSTPTALPAKYRMVKLDFGVPHDPAHWRDCTARPDCPDPKRNAWAESRVYTVAAAEFAESAPEALSWLRRRAWPAALAGEVALYMEENRYGGEDGARYFLEKYEDLWTSWLSPERAARVKSAR